MANLHAKLFVSLIIPSFITTGEVPSASKRKTQAMGLPVMWYLN